MIEGERSKGQQDAADQVEQFSAVPDACPKCDGMSFIDRYLHGDALRDVHGCFVVARFSLNEQLVVKCGLCGFERLMRKRYAEYDETEAYPAAARAIRSLDEMNQRIVLLRLAAKFNNGDEHFDHGEPGYSWLCHRCALEGKGGLNGWVGALGVIHAGGERFGG